MQCCIVSDVVVCDANGLGKSQERLMRQGNVGDFRTYDRTNPLGCVGLYGQAEKRIWWMPWQLEAMKDVVACDKPRGAGKQALIRGFPNGETHRFGGIPT